MRSGSTGRYRAPQNGSDTGQGCDSLTAIWLLWALAIAWLSFAPQIYLFLRGRPYLRRQPLRVATPPRLMVIQITTAGRAADVVDGILDAIRGYALGLPVETWVVGEEGDAHAYHADRVLLVPRSFRTPKGTLYKARALEYSRLVRAKEGLGTADRRVLFLDDDSLPSAAYVRAAFWADVDIAHGSITIRRSAKGRLIPHVADHYRTTDCVGTCPRYCAEGDVRVVHGEGLVCLGSVEQAIGWDWGQGRFGNKAEDLLFGRRACLLGYRYGYIPETLYIASPFTIRELFLQRRRWLWNVLSAWRDLDPLYRWFTLGRLGSGFIGLLAAFLLFYIPLSGTTLPLWLTIATLATTAAYFGYFGYGAWRNTGRRVEVVKAVLLAWPASLCEAGILIASVVRPPKGFAVVRKDLVGAPAPVETPAPVSAGGLTWSR